jgi:vanillate O-demethylase monooxygenase subunit
MYIRNAWYMAGWNRDFVAATPRHETILGEPVVLYRTEGGGMVALEDRCVHRLAPLSLGRCEGVNLRCMYHGLLFAPDGRCVEIPGQDLIPDRARVKSYPVVERHSAVWLWMGEADKADDGLIPEFVGYETPDFAIEPGRLDYDAPARLIHDNLLDLSHVAYVHANSFAGGNRAVTSGWLDADLKVKALPRGVRVSRMMENMPQGPAGASSLGATEGRLMDVWTSYEFLVPGIFLQLTRRFEQGSYTFDADGVPQGESQFETFTCQAVTPLTDKSACYFFAYGPWAREAGRKAFFAELGVKAFNEDKVMIEAQHRVMESTDAPRMMPMVMDRAVLAYEGVLKRLLREEGSMPARLSA